ncbi:unnamed protein product [Symbiodinium necroappetens]|uniref:Uncharacterized protein n=1 Tax=Symbiodinium necroappetens TaxID=1628268 RepID=A0A812PPD4_9DINO|nr:unnamed protein product [Symbiodinium necroappetens]
MESSPVCLGLPLWLQFLIREEHPWCLEDDIMVPEHPRRNLDFVLMYEGEGKVPMRTMALCSNFATYADKVLCVGYVLRLKMGGLRWGSPRRVACASGYLNRASTVRASQVRGDLDEVAKLVEMEQKNEPWRLLESMDHMLRSLASLLVALVSRLDK